LLDTCIYVEIKFTISERRDRTDFIFCHLTTNQTMESGSSKVNHQDLVGDEEEIIEEEIRGKIVLTSDGKYYVELTDEKEQHLELGKNNQQTTFHFLNFRPEKI
jgi:hypothetical protein